MGNPKGRTNAPCADVKTRLLRSILINAKTDCWEWQRTKNRKGYGQIGIKSGKMVATHRLSYQLHKGEIPEGLLVCHKCDNPSCVNPEHLFLGTNSDNIKDSFRKGRNCNKGQNSPTAKLKKEQVIKIRELSKTGKNQREIAKLFPFVSESTVHLIVKNKTWQNIKQGEM